MKKELKVGDTVFERIGVVYGNWGKTKAFMIPTKVVKVTKTQFVVTDGSRYSLSTFRGIGQKGKVVTKENGGRDQTADMKAFKEKKALIDKVGDLLYKLDVSCDKDHSLADLKALSNALEKIKTNS